LPGDLFSATWLDSSLVEKFLVCKEADLQECSQTPINISARKLLAAQKFVKVILLRFLFSAD
jgi:hypothetical protein